MKKRICLLLAVVCALTLSGCNDLPADPTPDTDPLPETSQPEEESVPFQEIALAYSHDDTLNPFSATTEVNCQLTGLLYEGLMAMEDGFVPKPLLASAVSQIDPTHLTATLRKGAVFSDGSAVTPADVVASFKEAKRSARYKALLTNVSSAAERNGMVVFTLTAADPNASACLTFPVVKAGTLTDEPATAPVGTGPYVPDKVQSGLRLKKNPRYKGTLNYDTVGLRHLPNTAAKQYALASGDLTYYFDDLSEGETPRVTGASRSVDMNAMVFVGVNGTKGKLSNPTVRRALSALLDRAAITDTVYAERATASVLPFHPGWTPLAEYPSSSARDLDGGVTLLDEAGCTAEGGVRLELELIYSTDRADRAKVADLIRTQLDGGGVTVTPVPLKEAEYLQRLKSGKYDLYIGEIRLTADMSLRPLLMGGDASYGVSRSGPAALAYRQYLAGDITVEEFLTRFAEDMPYIPVCWRSGLAAYNRRLTTLTPLGYDPYAGFADWK